MPIPPLRHGVAVASLALACWCAALSAPAHAAGLADLTPTEQRWLQGAWPVVAYARQAGLPLDIVVQPQPTPGAAPLALAFVAGRCKLVLSMRGNPEAQATLDRIAAPLLDATLELMAAHELGHCRRYLDGAWSLLPAGFAADRTAAAAAAVPDSIAAAGAALQAAWATMQAARREEAFGDLVGLAWTAQRHPALYATLHAWLVAERSADLLPGSHHDTLAWLRLAAGGMPGAPASPDAVAPASPDAPDMLFSAPAALWQQGLEMAALQPPRPAPAGD